MIIGCGMLPDSELTKLKKVFEGHRVISVLPSEDPWGICLFEMSDGSRYELLSNKLYSWIDAVADKDGRYRSFDSLFREYSSYRHSARKLSKKTTVSISRGLLKLSVAEGRVFEGDLGHFTLWERRVCAHPKGTKVIAAAAELGASWESYFRCENWDDIRPSRRCPEDLRLPWDEDWYRKGRLL